MDRDDRLWRHLYGHGRMFKRRGSNDLAGCCWRDHLGRGLDFGRCARGVRGADLIPDELLRSNRRRGGVQPSNARRRIEQGDRSDRGDRQHDNKNRALERPS
jgi:hypothetical protein